MLPTSTAAAASQQRFVPHISRMIVGLLDVDLIERGKPFAGVHCVYCALELTACTGGKKGLMSLSHWSK